MKVETYEIEEVKGELGNMAADSEAIELCRKMGLEGQLELANPKTDTRFPYRTMTAREMLVFTAHCPERTPLSKFRSGIIPIRVLQVAAHAQECEFLHHIEVWHPQDARLDPVLVGCKESYGGDLFLLARWGEHWKDFATLAQEAVPIIAARLRTDIQELIDKAQARLKRADDEAAAAINTGHLKDAKSGYDY